MSCKRELNPHVAWLRLQFVSLVCAKQHLRWGHQGVNWWFQVCVCVLHWEWMTILFFDVLFHCQTIHVYIIVSSTLGQRVPTSWWMPEAIYFLRGFFFCSKEVEDMCQRYSWIAQQFDAPSVLLPNAWFSLEPRLLLGRRWQKNQAVLGLSTGRDAENLKLSSTTESKSHFEAICLANYLHLPPFSVERRYTGVIFLPGCWFGFLPSTIFWVNFMSLLDLCVSLLMSYTALDILGNVRIHPSEAVDFQKLIFLKCKTSLCQRPGNRGNVPVLPVFLLDTADSRFIYAEKNHETAS